MTAPAERLSQDASLLDAALTFRRTGFRHLPVVDANRVVGIISDGDVQRLSPSLLGNVSQEEYNGILENTILKQIMTHDPVTVAPETQLREAAGILKNRKVGCLPVVQDGNLIGIITAIDMLSALLLLLDGAGKE